jgi:predicted nucleotidyltransferase component of viral defense system
MTDELRYATPVALRAAITARLRAATTSDKNRNLPNLLRQFAYDRLLYRIFTSEDADRWVLKGATALLARLHGEARHSIDIDLFNRQGALDEAEAALRAAAERNVRDHFTFALAPGRRIAEAGVALRVNVTAFLGAVEFAHFNVDLVANTGMTGVPEKAEPLILVDIPGVPMTTYRIYPLADHIADKVLAMAEQHARQDGAAIVSTRYRDLADLVLIARREVVDAEAVMVAFIAQAKRRHFDLPDELQPPDDPRWRAGYARVARDVPVLEKDFGVAVRTAKRFIDPVLQSTARGRWSPDHQAWNLTGS